MTATGHAVFGTAIAASISNPFIAAPIAIISHLVLDTLPHWDSGTHEATKSHRRIRNEAVIDVISSFIVSYLLIVFLFPKTDIWYAFFMVILAQGLDWAWSPYYFLNMKFPPFSWIFIISEKYFNTKQDKPWGIINQIMILLFFVVVIKLYFY